MSVIAIGVTVSSFLVTIPASSVTNVVTVTATVGSLPGSLDSTFGTGGVVTFDGAYSAAADAVLLVPGDNKIVVAAVHHDPSGSNHYIDVYRLTANGTLDPTWNSGMPYRWQGAGLQGTADGNSEPQAGIAQDNAGRIYVTSAVELNDNNHAAVAVLRLTTEGAADQAWGDADGVVRYHFGGFKNDHGAAVVVDDAGQRVYVAAQEGPDPALGNSGADFGITALELANGAVDTTFGHRGSATLDFNSGNDRVRDLTLLPGGHLLAVGSAQTSRTGPTDTGLWMLNANGTSDTAFGGTGHVQQDFAAGDSDGARSVALSKSGRIYVSGFDARSPGHGYVAAFRSDGALRSTFDGRDTGTGGVARSDFGAAPASDAGIAVGDDGRIVTTGFGGTSPAVARFVDAAYAVDTSFIGVGSEALPCATSGTGDGIAVQGDGRSVIAGVCGTSLRIWRVNGGDTVTLPETPTASTDNATVLTASNVVVGSGSGRSASVAAGSSVPFSFNWQLSNGAGNDQMAVGLVASGPTACTPLSTPTGQFTGSFTAPTDPGRYYLAFDLLHQGGCTPLKWAQDAPPVAQYLASLDVTPASNEGTSGNISNFALTATADEGGAWPGSLSTATSRISLNDLAGTLDTLTSAPLRGSPLRGSPLRGSPLRGSPLRGSPLRGSPLRGSPLAAPLRGSPIPLSDLPLAFGSSWSDLLGTSLQVPIQNATLNDVFTLDPVPPGVASLTLADIDWNSTPLRNVTLIAFLLAGIPASTFGSPTGTDGSKDFLTNEMAGVDLSAFYASGIQLAGLDLGNSPLAHVRLGDMNLADTPLGDVLTSAVPSQWHTCTTTCPSTLAAVQAADVDTGLTDAATVGDLLKLTGTAGRVVPSVTVGDLLPGLLPRDQLPYAEISPYRVATAAPIRSSHLVTYEAKFTITCASPAVSDPVVEFALPTHFRYVPGSATSSLGDVTVSRPVSPVDAVDVTTHLSTTCTPGTAATVSLRAEPGLDLGSFTANATATYAGVSADDASVTVVDNSGPVDGTADPNGDTSSVFLGRIAKAGEIDTFTVPAVPSGAQLTVTLAHVPAGQDYDLAVFGPQSPDLRASTTASPLRGSPLRGSGVPDTSTEPSSDGTTAPPEPLNDVPITPPSGDSVWGVSDNRGSVAESVSVVTPDGSSGDVTIQVSGFNGSFSPDTYSLAVSVVPQNPPPCGDSAPAVNASAAGGLPTGSPDPETLILTDRERLSTLYNDTAASSVMSKLTQLAGNPKVNGLVVPVEANAGVAAAYASWVADECSPAKANDVVRAINTYVDSLKGTYANFHNLRNVVIAGGDLVVPMARLSDHVALDNEDTYANDEVYNNHENPLSAALRDGYLLSDDPYGDFNPFAWLDGQAFVPDVALGRLVETPADITAAVDAFISSGGVRSPNTAYTAGYDFNADGAQQVADTLSPRVGTSTSTINGSWTKADALAGLTGSAHGFNSVNAHYDAYRALPASEFTSGTQTDLLTTASSGLPADFSGSILFTIGCHAGLSVADTFVATPGEVAQQADWSQTLLHRGAAGYAANTGYGYGDSVAVAYSEKLMADFAKNLDGSMTVGQALMFAKQSYLHLPLGAVDAKVMEEATFYGLPMYRLGTGGAAAGSAMPATPTVGGTLQTASTGDIVDDFSSQTGRHNVVQHTGQGDFYVVQNGSAAPQPPLALPGRPLQPQTSDKITPPSAASGLTAHGALVTGLTTRVVGPIDPVYSAAVPDGSGLTPEPGITEAFFPASMLGLVSRTSTGGSNDIVLVNSGQFRSSGTTGRGYQQLTDNVAYQVLYSNSADFVPPTINSVRGYVDAAGFVHFTVDAADNPGGTGVSRVSVLYLVHGSTSATQWKRVDLTGPTGGVYTGSDGLTPSTTTVVEQFIVEAVDNANNVATSTSKGRDFRADLAPDSGHPDVQLDGAQTNGGFAGAVTVTLTGAAPLSYVLDGGTAMPYMGPFVVDGAGSHTVVATDDAGDTTTRSFVIDPSPPTVSISSPLQGSTYGTGQPIAGVFSCQGDAPVTCSASPATPDTSAGQHTFTVTATDGRGNQETASVTYFVGRSARFAGFFQPINDPPTVMSVWKLGSTIPVKFQLLNQDGTPISDTLAASIASGCLAKLVPPKQVGTTSNPIDETSLTAPADVDSCFRYDATAHQFIYNLSSKSLPNAASGQVWQLRAIVYFSAGNTAGRMADHAVLTALK